MGIFKQTASLFRASEREMRKTRTLIIMALLMALSIVIASFRIRTPFFSISASSIVKMYAALLVGPVGGAAFGFARDLLQFFIANTGDAFFPGYTFTETLGMLLYGLFYFKRPVKFHTVLIGKLVVVIICNILLGTLWLSMMSGKAFLFYLPPRIVKNAIQWIVDSIVFYVAAKALERAGLTRMIQSDDM